MTNEPAKPRIRIDFRTFFILMLVAVVPMVVGTWWLFRSFESAYLERTGSDLSRIADTAFVAVNNYLQNQIMETAALTEVPVVREIVIRSNQDMGRDLDVIRKTIPKVEKAWATTGPQSPRLKGVLNNPAAEFLRKYLSINKSYRQVILTDFLGRLVAATEKPPHYYWALDEWWREAYADGIRGAVFIGNVRYDGTSRSYIMDLAQPVVNPDGNFAGMIKVVLDTQPIHALLGSIQSDPDMSVAVIHARGDIISAPGYSSLEFRNYPATLDILNARDRDRRSFVTSEPPFSVYGISQHGLAEIFPHLNWLVVASTPVAGLLGPLIQLRNYFIALLLGIFLATFLATLMLSRVESRPIIEEDPHLERL
jgi:hypothetical protein